MDQQLTDQHRAIQVKHISPSWVEWFDQEVGRRGYFDAIIRGVKGAISNTKFQDNFTSDAWRKGKRVKAN